MKTLSTNTGRKATPTITEALRLIEIALLLVAEMQATIAAMQEALP